MKRIFISVMVSLCCFFVSGAHASDTKRSVAENGLIVLQVENHSLPIVMITLIVKAGQIDEPEEKSGLAYLTADLLTEGTKKRTAKDISETIDFIGASLDTSAGNDYTTISLSVLKKDIHKGFDVLADVLLNPDFPEEEIKRKKEQIKGLLQRLEEEPSFLAERAFQKAVFGNYPYGRVLQGTAGTIHAIIRDDLSSFYKKYFLPNNSILSVVGDLTEEELSALLRKYLSSWQKGKVVLSYPIPEKEAEHDHVIKIDKDLTQANILMGKRGVQRGNSDYYRLSVLNYILGGGGFSSRLVQSVRDTMGLAYDIHSFSQSLEMSGFFEIAVQTKNESANIVIKEIFSQVKSIRTEAVSDQELSDAQSYLIGSFKRRLDTNRKIADFLALVEFYGLGLDYIDTYPGYIKSVTKEDILHIARKYLDPEQFVIVVVADQQKAEIQY